MSEPERVEMQAVVDRHLADREQIRVLEAGCGSWSYVEYRSRAYVVGIDIDASQLERNEVIDEKIRGDLQEYPLPAATFDLSVCWDVLEHLPHPDRALINLFHAAKPGGLIVLAFPNVRSLKGMVTKWTPHALHVWVYRHVFHVPTAGLPGHAPFPTYLRSSIAPDAVVRLAAKHSMSVLYAVNRETWLQHDLRRRLHLTGRVWEALRNAVATLSRGTIDLEGSDCIMVLQAQPDPAAGEKDRDRRQLAPVDNPV